MRGSLFVTVLALLATGITPPALHEVEAAEKTRRGLAWVTDLRKADFGLNETSSMGVVEAIRRIAFGDDDELVVVGGDTSFDKHGTLQGFVLDARTGAITNRASWTGKSFPYIFATANGEYVANTEKGLTLYSKGLRGVVAERTREIKLASPDGLSLAEWEGVPGRGGVTTLLDSATLQPTGDEFVNIAVDSMSRDSIAYTAWMKRSKYQSVIVMNSGGARAGYEPECKEVQPRFISQTHLVVFGCGRFEVIKSGGPRLFMYSTDGEDSFGGASRDGNRFIVVEALFGAWGHEPGLRSERFTVYDVRTGEAVFKTTVRELRGQSNGRSGSALSPNGLRLAVNSLGIVRLFNLPSTNSESLLNGIDGEGRAP